ncbi:hypothetical protein BKA70DRAFT_1560258 [Coprinopsis sp. MPI-PUGE-AT-0042]|nr:hypothetical protein BKA70DRAFT_1560258 [Coprinopsis sp. MPI-PUGE-AT-0042]
MFITTSSLPRRIAPTLSLSWFSSTAPVIPTPLNTLRPRSRQQACCVRQTGVAHTAGRPRTFLTEKSKEQFPPTSRAEYLVV